MNNVCSTQLIIEKLGYQSSDDLFYYNDISTNDKLSFHVVKVLKELKPCDFYCIENKPFILFFDKIHDPEKMKELNKKIWNFQIPVAIFNGESTIKIYNGSALNAGNLSLDMIDQQKIEECDEYSPFSYWSVTDKSFWQDFAEEYSFQKLNEILLENIEYVTNNLKKIHNIKFATKLVLRLIFIRFLIDRGVDIAYSEFSSDVHKSQMELLKIAKDKSALYSLFEHLKGKFNGNLFDLGSESNDKNLTCDVFELLHDFLSGKLRLPSGQLCLFSMYDFNIIPVELISNIYEILLGKETQSQDKAFYTPFYLVDYILKQSISPYLNKKKECRVLDPACGSGIFLVECFRRIVEKNLDENGYFKDDEKLKQLLLHNVYGVDKSDEAIDITIFSLYLTILDYKDPKTLVEFKLPYLKNENLIVGNFFDDTKTFKLKAIKFDFIIGNPPWGSDKDEMHMQYCRKNDKPNQNREISRSFVYKVEEFCASETVCCLVLPSKLLYNNKLPAAEFRKFLLTSAKIEKIIELSSVRKLVFKNADAPAMIIMFKHDKSEYLKNRITHISFKPNIFFKLFNIIVVEKNDIKFVAQELLFKNDWAWKTIVYGSSWDLDIIKNCRKKYPTIKEIIKENKFISGAGIKDNVGDGKDSTHLLSKLILDSNEGIDHFFINTSKADIFNKPKIDRPRNPELFKPPYCLITTGVNCDNYKMRAAYSESEFLYRNAIYSIKGDTKQKDLLLNLTGLFNSSFFSYLNFMLGSSIGIEREQRVVKEVFDFPYLDSDEIQRKVQLIQTLKNNNKFGMLKNAEEEIRDLDNLILRLFGLEDNPFVDYILKVQIPLIANADKIVPYQAVENENLIKYAEIFINYFETIYYKVKKFVKVIIYPIVMKKFSIFELIICEEEPTKRITIMENVSNNKKLISRFMVNKTNDMFYQIKDVINFEEKSFFIIKTNEYKNWHPAMAQIDLAEVIDEMLSEYGGEP